MSGIPEGVIPGPAKKRRKGPPCRRLTHHKTRALWFQARASWPVREAPVHALVRERERVWRECAHAPGKEQWEFIGPDNIGGRVTSLALHPHDADVIWAGAAGGGVWKSEDAGRHWKPQWHDQPVLTIGALAIDNDNPDRLYCATGEANLSSDSYAGVGIFTTSNGGKTWRLMAPCERTGLPKRIGAIAIDPFDAKHLIVGGVEFEPKGRGGMHVSSNGGRSWKRLTFISDKNYWCHHVCFHPTERGVVYATFTERGARSGIWRSLDGGESWQQLTAGLPETERFGRTSVAIAPSQPCTLYALASTLDDLVLGIYRSDDGGDNWVDIGKKFKAQEQMTYGNAIVVHPTKPDHVLAGGVDLQLTEDGGKTWKQVTRWDAQRGKPNYAHGDHHCLLMPAHKKGRVYDANDGGMELSEDGGHTWTNRSDTLAVNMYYDVDVAQSDGRTFGGGAQDNGTLITTDGSTKHHRILTGDGGWTVYDPKDAHHFYASYYNMGIFRWRHGEKPQDVSPPASEHEKNSVWMVYIIMDPQDSRVVYTGSKRVWRTRNDGETWKPISPELDGSPISAIEVAPADPNRIYVGTENGCIFRSLDRGKTWSSGLSGAGIPGHTITRIETGPANADLVFVTVANFGHSHVFRSDDGGRHWTDVDRGRLPDVPHNAIAIPPDDPETVYVANDAGVFVSQNLGGAWRNLTRNLPNAMFVDLVYHLHDGTLTCGTYGRGLWRLQVRRPQISSESSSPTPKSPAG